MASTKSDGDDNSKADDTLKTKMAATELSEEEEENQPVIPEALDGGYGWVIVVAAFFIHIVVDGASFGYGVMSKHIKDYYKVSESQATLVGSLQLGFYLLSCPFAGKMVERWGFRVTCMIGTTLATIGFVTAPLSPNIYVMMITYGVIAGTGFGMMYLASISAVTFYFDKKRVLATGLATTGSGIGMFAFSAICNSLTDLLNWQSALLIVGGIAMQGYVFGMLLLPLSNFSKTKPKQIKYSTKDDEVTASLLAIPQGKQLNNPWPEPQTRRSNESGFESDDGEVVVKVAPPVEPDSDSESKKSLQKPENVANGAVSSKGSNLDKADVVIKSLHDISKSLEQLDDKTEKHRMHEDVDFNQNAKPKLTSKEKARNCLNSIVDIKLLKDPIFYVICVANIFCFLGLTIPLKFQVDRAMTFDIASTPERTQELADFLVSVSGIANTVGRAASSLLDINRDIDKILLYNLAVLGCGVACFFNVFSVTYALMCVFSCCFTFLVGLYIALSSVVVCEMMGPDAVNNAFALMCMLRGFANIAGGPIAGAAYDSLQNYDVCFYIGGSMMVAGGLTFCILLLPKMRKRSYVSTMVVTVEDEADHKSMIASVVNLFAAPDQGTPRMARAHLGTPQLGRSIPGTPRLYPGTPRHSMTNLGTPRMGRSIQGTPQMARANQPFVISSRHDLTVP